MDGLKQFFFEIIAPCLLGLVALVFIIPGAKWVIDNYNREVSGGLPVTVIDCRQPVEAKKPRFVEQSPSELLRERIWHGLYRAECNVVYWEKEGRSDLTERYQALVDEYAAMRNGEQEPTEQRLDELFVEYSSILQAEPPVTLESTKKMRKAQETVNLKYYGLKHPTAPGTSGVPQ